MESAASVIRPYVSLDCSRIGISATMLSWTTQIQLMRIYRLFPRYRYSHIGIQINAVQIPRRIARRLCTGQKACTSYDMGQA
jgi:hypothetical protein